MLFPTVPTRLRLLVSALVAATLPQFAFAADDRQYIEISGAHFKPLPLAVAPTGGDAAAARAVEATLLADLGISGLFDVLDPRSFLADKKEGFTASAIDFSKWNAVGADSLLKAKVARDEKGLKLDFRLFDVLGGREVLKGTLSGGASDARMLAHRLADRLVEHFTGEKGPFQTRLAFVRRLGDSKEVWVADFDGHNAVSLTPGGGLNLLPAWSPDGRRVLYTSYRDAGPMLFSADVATRQVRAMPERGDLTTGGAYSPDGRRIAFTMSQNGNSDIWVMNADGTNPVRLTETRETESTPSWSPDGKRIAFVSARSGDPQIFAMNADGSGVERITFQGRYNQTPVWSPRGDAIVFTARDERYIFDIFTVNPQTKKIARLTQDQGDNEQPSYSPNGRHIVFTSTRSGKRRLWMMNADGTNQRPLAFDGEAATPAWGPWTD